MKKNTIGSQLRVFLSLLFFILLYLGAFGPLKNTRYWAGQEQWVKAENQDQLRAMESRLDALDVSYLSSSSPVLIYQFNRWESLDLQDALISLHEEDPRLTPGLYWLRDFFKPSGEERILIRHEHPPWFMAWEFREFLDPGNFFTLRQSLGYIILAIVLLASVLLRQSSFGDFLFHLLWLSLFLVQAPKWHAPMASLFCLQITLPGMFPGKIQRTRILAVCLSWLLGFAMKDWFFCLMAIPLVLLMEPVYLRSVKRDHNLFEPVLFTPGLKLPKRKLDMSTPKKLLLPSLVLILSPLLVINWHQNQRLAHQEMPSLQGIESVGQHLLFQRALPIVPLGQFQPNMELPLEHLVSTEQGVSWETLGLLNRESVLAELKLEYPGSLEMSILDYNSSQMAAPRFPWSVIALSLLFYILTVVLILSQQWLPQRGGIVIEKVKRRLKVA